MKKYFLSLSILFALFFITPFAFAASGDISVLLGKYKSGSIAGNSMTVTAADRTISLSGNFSVASRGDTVTIGNSSLRMPVKITSQKPISWNNKAYDGAIVIRNAPEGFSIGNVIDVELYLPSVLKAEMSNKWPIEALKAQAIIARTFAFKEKGKMGAYDLCDSVNSQVYKGVIENDPQISRAISETRGLILQWQGKPASTFYHSDSGGMVTDSASVWGGDLPYLKPKVEPFRYSGPNTEWQVTIPMSQIESQMRKNGIETGKIKYITPLKRDASGRIVSIEIRGSRGAKTISGNKFRVILGSVKIKSTMFEMGSRSAYRTTPPVAKTPEPKRPAPPQKNKKYEPMKVDLSQMPAKPDDCVVWMTKHRVFTTQELMEILSKPDKIDSYIKMGIGRIKGELPPPSYNIPTALKPQTPQSHENFSSFSMTPGTGESVTFYGRGYGHGVGLSQWGAKTMAEKGWGYAEILAHYFPGTVISQ